MFDQLWYLPLIIGASTVGMILFSFGIVLFVMALVRRGEARRQELLSSGEPAEATVISTGYTGVRVNRRRQIATQLEVRRGGQLPYRATDRYYLDGQIFSNTPLYPPGATVHVRVDPQDPKRVAIVGLAGGFAASSAFSQAFGGAPSDLFSQALAGLPPQVNSTNMFMVNGKQYGSLEEMPPEVRQALAKVGDSFGDANNNGMPDIFEQAAVPAGSPSERLAELKRMLDQGLISAQEYETKRAEILRQV